MIRCIAFLLLLTTSVHADSLKVGFVDMPPFSWQNDAGHWTGVAVDLWTRTAEYSDLDWIPVKVDSPDSLVEQLSTGTIDVAAAALTVTPERAKVIDFMPAFEVSSVGHVAQPDGRLRFGVMLEALSDSAFLGLSLLVLGLALFFGVAIWLVERHKNAEEFGGDHHHGLGNGLWWSIVTMSTVGYGDKSPRTFLGRMIAGTWILLALILVSVFTGAAASAFSQRTANSIATTGALEGRSVGALEEGSTQRWLRSKGINAKGFSGPIEGIKAVKSGEIDAFAGEVSMLRWVILEEYIDDLEVLSGLRQERLAFAIRPGLPQERDLTVGLLTAMASPAWRELLRAHGWPAPVRIR